MLTFHTPDGKRVSLSGAAIVKVQESDRGCLLWYDNRYSLNSIEVKEGFDEVMGKLDQPLDRSDGSEYTEEGWIKIYNTWIRGK